MAFPCRRLSARGSEGGLGGRRWPASGKACETARLSEHVLPEGFFFTPGQWRGRSEGAFLPGEWSRWPWREPSEAHLLRSLFDSSAGLKAGKVALGGLLSAPLPVLCTFIRRKFSSQQAFFRESRTRVEFRNGLSVRGVSSALSNAFPRPTLEGTVSDGFKSEAKRRFSFVFLVSPSQTGGRNAAPVARTSALKRKCLESDLLSFCRRGEISSIMIPRKS